jgi:hypothetical protein
MYRELHERSLFAQNFPSFLPAPKPPPTILDSSLLRAENLGDTNGVHSHVQQDSNKDLHIKAVCLFPMYAVATARDFKSLIVKSAFSSAGISESAEVRKTEASTMFLGVIVNATM